MKTEGASALEELCRLNIANIFLFARENIAQVFLAVLECIGMRTYDKTENKTARRTCRTDICQGKSFRKLRCEKRFKINYSVIEKAITECLLINCLVLPLLTRSPQSCLQTTYSRFIPLVMKAFPGMRAGNFQFSRRKQIKADELI